MPHGERDPSSDSPISAEWQGSHIRIHDLNGILDDAASQKTVIFDDNDFPHPMERVQVTAEVIRPEGVDALALESTIQLKEAHGWKPDVLEHRFKNHLAPKDESNTQYRKRLPFYVEHKNFAKNVISLEDIDTGGNYVLYIHHEVGRLVLTNCVNLTANEQQINIIPPRMHTIKPERHLMSLMKATALVSDFVNAFNIFESYDSRMKGIPLKRNYDVRRERRAISDPVLPKFAESLAKVNAMFPEPFSSPDTPSSTTEREPEEESVEKIASRESVTLSDIGGLAGVKEKMQEVVLSFKHPEIMEKWGAERPQGVLFYGDPGTGKTMLAQALAHEIGADVWNIQSTDIYHKWLGKSEQKITEIFDRALKVEKPTILFFDEFESMVGISDESSLGGSSARDAVAGVFKKRMNSLAKENPNLLVVAATNNVDSIDPSLIRSGRFNYKIYVPMPDQEARQEIVINTLSKAIASNEEGTFRIYDDIKANELAAQTEGFSGADITEIFRRLSFSKAMKEARSGKEQAPITQADIEEAIVDFRTDGLTGN
jgi:AAA+ superfamily predicted ATPase